MRIRRDRIWESNLKFFDLDFISLAIIAKILQGFPNFAFWVSTKDFLTILFTNKRSMVVQSLRKQLVTKEVWKGQPMGV
jgi:hypothetical protein